MANEDLTNTIEVSSAQDAIEFLRKVEWFNSSEETRKAYFNLISEDDFINYFRVPAPNNIAKSEEEGRINAEKFIEKSKMLRWFLENKGYDFIYRVVKSNDEDLIRECMRFIDFNAMENIIYKNNNKLTLEERIHILKLYFQFGRQNGINNLTLFFTPFPNTAETIGNTKKLEKLVEFINTKSELKNSEEYKNVLKASTEWKAKFAKYNTSENEEVKIAKAKVLNACIDLSVLLAKYIVEDPTAMVKDDPKHRTPLFFLWQ